DRAAVEGLRDVGGLVRAGGQPAVVDASQGEGGESAGPARERRGGAAAAVGDRGQATGGSRPPGEGAQARRIAQRDERAVTHPPAWAPGPAWAEAEDEGAGGGEIAPPRAQVPAQARHRPVPGALKNELHRRVTGRGGVQRAHERK